jgi:ATP-dependent DNA ligase
MYTESWPFKLALCKSGGPIGPPRCAASRSKVRKATLASVLVKVSPSIRLNEHIQHEDGEIVFRHACKLGLEGIVSKRKDSTYRPGRSPDWLKMKNPGLLVSAIVAGMVVQKMQASISRECDLAHTSPPGSFLRPA